MNFQLKPESEFTIQGYLYLMEKSKLPSKYFVTSTAFSVSKNVNSLRSLHCNMAEILLHVQEAKQAVHDAAIQSTDTWTHCKTS